VRTKDAPYLVAATPNSITVKWAVPEGVAPACYHLQKSLVSENELDEGPWESAISGSDDEVRRRTIVCVPFSFDAICNVFPAVDRCCGGESGHAYYRL